MFRLYMFRHYGETYRGLTTRLKEHKANIRHHRTTNALVNHMDDKGHLPDWDNVKTLIKGKDKKEKGDRGTIHSHK